MEPEASRHPERGEHVIGVEYVENASIGGMVPICIATEGISWMMSASAGMWLRRSRIWMRLCWESGKLQRVLDTEKLKLQDTTDGSCDVDSVKSALKSVKKAKQMLFGKLADRSIDWEAFREKKAEMDVQIAELEQKLEGTKVSAALAEDAAGRMNGARSFLDVESMTEEMWEKFVRDVYLYPGERMEIRWNFEDENMD